MAGPGSAAKAKKARRGPRPDRQTYMAVAGSRVSACDPLPFLLPFWLWTLHNTLYLSSTASPSSLLSSRSPRQHRRRWSPSCCAGRVARRDPQNKAAARAGPHPRNAPPAPVQIKKVWQCWPPWPGKLRKYGKSSTDPCGNLKKPWQRP